MQSIGSSRVMTVMAIFCLFFLTMCRSYEAEPIDYENGLVCQAYTDYFKDGSSIEKGNECKYTCPDGLVLIVDETRISEPKADLRGTFCGVENIPTASLIPPTATPTSSTTQPSTETPSASPTPVQPLLSEVTTCNEYAGFVNFRLIESMLEVQGRNLIVTIDDRVVDCGVDPAFPSILTCDLPPFMDYPATVLVSVNEVQVNEFQLEELSCSSNVPTQIDPPGTTESAEATPTQLQATDIAPEENPTSEPPATQPG